MKAARLPSGKDPAELISEDVKDFTKRITAAKPIVEFFLAELAQGESDPHRLLRLAEGIVLPLLAAIPSPMEREHFIQTTARSLSLSNDAVRESLKRLPASQELQRGEPKLSEVTGGTSVQRNVPSPVRSSIDIRSEHLIAVVHAYQGTPLAERVTSEYCRITGADELPPVALPESALFFAEQTFGEDPGEQVGDELLCAFEEAVIREAYQTAVTQLRRAEASGDVSLIVGAQNQCTKLSARLAVFGA